MLVESKRYTRRDKEAWDRLERIDALTCRTDPYHRRVARAKKELAAFARQHIDDCYAGASWGKDSTVLMHLVAVSGLRIPCCYVKVLPLANPDCVKVRDVFLAKHDIDYHEIVLEATRKEDGFLSGGETLRRGFKMAAKRWGKHRITGIRSAESNDRARRQAMWGASSILSCAPITYWLTSDVWAYLYEHGLPVHPTYACSLGGFLDRDQLRVAGLKWEGEEEGMRPIRGGMRRVSHEQQYYREEIKHIAMLRNEWLRTHAHDEPGIKGGGTSAGGTASGAAGGQRP